MPRLFRISALKAFGLPAVPAFGGSGFGARVLNFWGFRVSVSGLGPRESRVRDYSTLSENGGS